VAGDDDAEPEEEVEGEEDAPEFGTHGGEYMAAVGGVNRLGFWGVEQFDCLKTHG
jgi:hypothetical protein